MKTVVYIGGELPDKDASALRILANGKALRECGYRVVFISQSREMPANCVSKDLYDGFEIYYNPFPKGMMDWVQELFSIKIFKKIIEKYDDISAVICYNPHAIVFEKMVRYGHKHNIKVIADCTEWHTVSHLHGFRKVVKEWDINRRITKSQHQADGIITISAFFSEYYKKIENRIVVPPLADTSEQKWHIAQKDESKLRFVYAGRIGIGKDSLNVCIEAMKEFNNSEFIVDIVGVTKEEYIKQFPEQKQLLTELKDKLCFHGMLSHQQALEYVQRGSFSFLIREKNRKNTSGFPTKLPESIACGTPVIATDFSDVKEYVVKYNLGIMVDTPDDVKTGIAKALAMPREEYIEMVNSCRECRAFDYRTYSTALGNFISILLKQ